MSDDKQQIVMLKTHKNGFIQLMRNADLTPERFQVRETFPGGRPHFVLSLLGTPFRFTTRMNHENYDDFDCQFVRFAPGFPLSDWYPSKNWCHIGDIYSKFSAWLVDDIRRFFDEVEEPDLWAQIQSQKSVVSDAPLVDDDREPYTGTEQTQLRMAIKEFRQLVIDRFEPTGEHLSLIDDRLDYLSEQVSQLNRINWRSLALSTLISITIALSLNNEQGKELFELFKRVFTNVVLLLQ